MRVLACSIPVRRGVQRVVAVGVDGDQVALGRPVESGRGPHPVLLAGRWRTDADRPDRPGPIDRLTASAPQERQRSRLRAVGPRDQVARDGFGGHGRGSPGDLPWPRRGPRLSIGVIPGNQSYRCGSIILGPAGRGKCLDVVHRRARRRNRVLSRENPLRASGRVALAVTRQGSHRPVRAHIRAYGSSADSPPFPKGPRSYPTEFCGHA